MTGHWNLNVDSLRTYIIYLDMKRAFDRVSHEKLLKKCQAYGIQGSLVACISDLLDSRRQLVRVDGAESLKQPVLSGVPQGSVLGPILFTIYINDLGDCLSPGTSIKFFADDAKVYRAIRRPEDQAIL